MMFVSHEAWEADIEIVNQPMEHSGKDSMLASSARAIWNTDKQKKIQTMASLVKESIVDTGRCRREDLRQRNVDWARKELSVASSAHGTYRPDGASERTVQAVILPLIGLDGRRSRDDELTKQ